MNKKTGLKMKKTKLFKGYISFLNKKTKDKLSYDFHIKSVYGFLKKNTLSLLIKKLKKKKV
jgi:hypothetical protein